FRSQDEANKFATYVAIARAASADFKQLITQELIVGTKPKDKGVAVGDIIGTRYSGWLLDSANQIGTLFDSNATQKDKASTFKFRVGEGKVIKGWEEGILGMKKGGKRVLVVPSEMAYGKTGHPPSIPPYSRLLFEVFFFFFFFFVAITELLQIEL